MPLTRRRHIEAKLAARPTDIYAEFMAGWDRLEIHGQAIRSTETGGIVATEALVRWRRGPGELWSAGLVLPIAEEVGLADECTQRALEMSIAAWAGSTTRTHGGRLALNLHRSRLESRTLADEIIRLCADFAVEPDELILEIPDRLGPDGCRAAADSLRPLHDAGAILALDDHRGEASSTTPQPSWLPVGSLVKLDAAITHVCDHQLGRDLLASTADELHRLGYVVAVEMVERSEQFHAARACGVELAQGHLFGTPQLFS